MGSPETTIPAESQLPPLVADPQRGEISTVKGDTCACLSILRRFLWHPEIATETMRVLWGLMYDESARGESFSFPLESELDLVLFAASIHLDNAALVLQALGVLSRFTWNKTARTLLLSSSNSLGATLVELLVRVLQLHQEAHELVKAAFVLIFGLSRPGRGADGGKIGDSSSNAKAFMKLGENLPTLFEAFERHAGDRQTVLAAMGALLPLTCEECIFAGDRAQTSLSRKVRRTKPLPLAVREIVVLMAVMKANPNSAEVHSKATLCMMKLLSSKKLTKSILECHDVADLAPDIVLVLFFSVSRWEILGVQVAWQGCCTLLRLCDAQHLKQTLIESARHFPLRKLLKGPLSNSQKVPDYMVQCSKLLLDVFNEADPIKFPNMRLR